LVEDNQLKLPIAVVACCLMSSRLVRMRTAHRAMLAGAQQKTPPMRAAPSGVLEKRTDVPEVQYSTYRAAAPVTIGLMHAYYNSNS